MYKPENLKKRRKNTNRENQDNNKIKDKNINSKKVVLETSSDLYKLPISTMKNTIQSRMPVNATLKTTGMARLAAVNALRAMSLRMARAARSSAATMKCTASKQTAAYATPKTIGLVTQAAAHAPKALT